MIKNYLHNQGRIFFQILGFAVVLLGASTLTSSVSALSGSEFTAGRIIDDGVFYNSKTMTASQIQQFFNSKVPVCDTDGSEIYSGSTTRADFGRANGNPPPFTCLKDYSQSTPTMNDSGYCSLLQGGTKSAAQIVYDVSQSCGINPQVLIVLLQKEQSLVTDDWPWKVQYDNATGFACPDTAPCDPAYEGFFYQVYNAARQYRVYQKYPQDYNYQAGRDNRIYWHPDLARCGSSTVRIQNQATAGLYIYTPYRPNQAALDNLYGTGDSCSSYGNRNFWRLFRDWFGSTYADPYHSTYVSQSPNPSLNPGSTSTAWIEFKNTGQKSWYSNSSTPVRIATTNPVNRESKFYDPSWASPNRPSIVFDKVYKTDGTTYTTTPTEVKPGETVRFSFKLNVPSDLGAGSYKETFGLVAEAGAGLIPTSPTSPWITVSVNKSTKAQYVSQAAYPSLSGGQATISHMTFKNIGNTTWYDNTTFSSHNSKPIRLATVNPVNRSSAFGDSTWGVDRNRPSGIFHTVYDKNRVAYATNPHTVKPGESVKFEFTITSPDNYTPNTYREYIGLVEDGGVGALTMPVTPWIDVTVSNTPAAKPTVENSTEKIVQTTTLTTTYSFKNTGSTTWSRDATTLRVTSGDTAGIKHSSWLDNATPSRLNEASVAPGGIGTFTITYNGASATGKRLLTLSPAINGTDIGVKDLILSLLIEEARYSAGYFNQTQYPTMLQNTNTETIIRFKNTGNIAWRDVVGTRGTSFKPVVLAATKPINRTSAFNTAFDTPNRASITFNRVLEGNGIDLASDQHLANPGQIAEFKFTLTATDGLSPGTYREFFQPILEGGSPWSMGQVAWIDIRVKDSINRASFKGQSPHPILSPGQSSAAYFLVENTGNSVWHDTVSTTKGIKPAVLAATDPINRISSFNGLFDTPNRPSITFGAVFEKDGATMSSNQHTVEPGQIVRFDFQFTVPSDTEPGVYREMFEPIIEGGSPWSMGQRMWLYVTVK